MNSWKQLKNCAFPNIKYYTCTNAECNSRSLQNLIYTIVLYTIQRLEPFVLQFSCLHRLDRSRLRGYPHSASFQCLLRLLVECLLRLLVAPSMLPDMIGAWLLNRPSMLAATCCSAYRERYPPRSIGGATRRRGRVERSLGGATTRRAGEEP